MCVPWCIFPADRGREMCPDVPGELAQSSALCRLTGRRSPPPPASSPPSSSSSCHFAPLWKMRSAIALHIYHHQSRTNRLPLLFAFHRSTAKPANSDVALSPIPFLFLFFLPFEVSVGIACKYLKLCGGDGDPELLQSWLKILQRLRVFKIKKKRLVCLCCS